MKRILTITILLCSLFLVSCSQVVKDDTTVAIDKISYESQADYVAESEPEALPVETLPDPVMINADFSVITNKEGSFRIATNLPDGTELMLTLKGRAYLAQGEAFVKDGVAVSERFTNKGNQLIGDYELEVLMPIPSVQSEYVKHFIGEDGEYLTGPYIQPALTSVVVSKKFDVSFEPESSQSSNSEKESTSTTVNNNRTSNGNYYRTPTGKKYHLDPDCGGKNSYGTTDISGLSPCSKCVK